jgi:hypothetical protein
LDARRGLHGRRTSHPKRSTTLACGKRPCVSTSPTGTPRSGAWQNVRSPAEGERITTAAKEYIGEEYSALLSRELAKEYVGIGRGRDKVATTNEFICSTVYEQAVAEAFETGLAREPGIRGITVPAMLARSPFLTPVEAGWRTTVALPAPVAREGVRPNK